MSPQAATAVASLRAWAEDVRRTALADIRWEGISPADLRRVEALTRAIVDGILREPAERARRAAEDDDVVRVVAELRALFPPEVTGRITG